MRTLTTVAELRHALGPLRAGSTIGLVPTMGALHAGHRALFEAARAECDLVVASIFVNPAQFQEQSDLDAYPHRSVRRSRTRPRRPASISSSPLPTTSSTRPVSRPGSSPRAWRAGLEGEARPGHFRGVATACLKLFTIARPDIAYFGRKDAQQVAVVKQLVRDLNLELEIRVVPTVRDPDGLALSSRNARLSADERRRALAIPRALATLDPGDARRILDEAGVEPDYVAVADLDGPTLAVAARVGSTRLIDNVLLEGDRS